LPLDRIAADGWLQEHRRSIQEEAKANIQRMDWQANAIMRQEAAASKIQMSLLIIRLLKQNPFSLSLQHLAADGPDIRRHVDGCRCRQG
jgi:hypothetical protein